MFGWIVDFKFFLIKKANRFSFFWKTFKVDLEGCVYFWNYVPYVRKKLINNFIFFNLNLFLLLPFILNLSLESRIFLGCVGLIEFIASWLLNTGFFKNFKKNYLENRPDIIAFEEKLMILHLNQKLKASLSLGHNKKVKRL